MIIKFKYYLKLMERKSAISKPPIGFGSRPTLPKAPTSRVESNQVFKASAVAILNKENARVSGGPRSLSQAKALTPKGTQGLSVGFSLQQPSVRKAVGSSSQVRGLQQEESKDEPPKKGMFTEKPSDRFSKIKTADPFSGGKKHKTNFGYVYSAGSIPCRVKHGSVANQIHWDKSPEQLDYDPLLINCFEGLLETEHPYSFVSNRALIELLEAPGSPEKTIPLVQKLIMPLRNAFISSDGQIWNRGLSALKLLAETVGHNLTPHIHILLAQLNKKMTMNKKVRENVMQVLNTIEERGGKEALEAIRGKVPTYTSIYM